MQPEAGTQIDIQKSNNFLGSWSPQTAEVCAVDIALSMNQPPPVVRGRSTIVVPERKSVEVPERRKVREDPYVNTALGLMKAAETVSSTVNHFQQWLKSPPPAPSVKAPALKTVPPFDIQQIPGAMRKIGAPVGAAVMERWFAGQLNYSPTPTDEKEGINQNGQPYPPNMIDTTLVKIDWVMKFPRAKRALNELLTLLGTPRARAQLATALRPYRSRQDIRAWLECGGGMEQLHKEFQFQHASIEGSLDQKLKQFAITGILNEGIPDDLTCALGSFQLYAAISQATFNRRSNSSTATLTHISVYVKDNYTFTDEPSHVAQYLGHWNRNHVAIGPALQLATTANIGWVDYAVAQGDVHSKDAVLYPVKNSDFRAWQQKHGQGGDFIIYTDRMFMKLDTPITVAL